MRLYRYPGLFGDPRSRGLWAAVVASLFLHSALFVVYSRFHIRPPSRTFFAPFQMVDLAGPKSGSGAKAGSAPPPKAPPPESKQPEHKKSEPAATTAKPPAPPPPKPKPQEKQLPAPKPDEKAIPKPVATDKVKPLPKPDPREVVTPEPRKEVAPEPKDRVTEQRVADRIAQLRAKVGADKTAAAPGAGSEEALRDKIEKMGRRIGPPEQGSAGQGGAGQDGIGPKGGGSNVLQEVLLRSYYNRLWDQVNSHWTIPPPLQGKAYSVVVSIVIDRQGRLLKSWIEERSPSDAFDQSALRALERAQPLPAMPDTVAGDSLEIGFRFHGE